MTYEVIRAFKDKDNKKHYYRKGDTYPVEGYEPSKERINELLGDKNDVEQPLIKKVGPEEETEETAEGSGADDEFPKHTGSGWYELSNGEKVQGEEKAIEAENELK